MGFWYLTPPFRRDGLGWVGLVWKLETGCCLGEARRTWTAHRSGFWWPDVLFSEAVRRFGRRIRCTRIRVASWERSHIPFSTFQGTFESMIFRLQTCFGGICFYSFPWKVFCLGKGFAERTCLWQQSMGNLRSFFPPNAMFWMTTRRPFFRGAFCCWGGQWGGSVDSSKVGTRWIFLTSEVWGVQELCSARIASRWSADTDFGRRGAVPTAGVVVVSFLGGEGVGKVKPAKMCRTKNPGKVPTRGNIRWLHEEVEELDDLMTFFSPQKMYQVEACEEFFTWLNWSKRSEAFPRWRRC